MATSDSWAQDVILCDLCDKATKQFCNSCQVSLCDTCVKRHRDQFTSLIHEIVPFLDRKIQMVCPECQHHPGQRCDANCLQCNKPACVKCMISGPHKGHEVEELTKTHKNIKQKIEKDTGETKDKIIPKYQRKKAEIENFMSKTKTQFDEIKTESEKLRKLWHQEVDSIFDKIDSMSQSYRDENLNVLQAYYIKIKKLISEMNETVKQNENLLNSNQLSEVCEYKSKLMEWGYFPEKPITHMPTLGSENDQGKELSIKIGDFRAILTQLSSTKITRKLLDKDLLEYNKKMRILQIKTLDGMQKKLEVDDSHTVGQLMVTICTKMGILNHEGYSLVREMTDNEMKKLTRSGNKSIAKDQIKLEEMKNKLHNEDEQLLDHSRTLREQGVADEDVLILSRKLSFSDQNMEQRDPVQLSLLYEQSRDAIINGTLPVTRKEAIHLAGIQCQIQFGDYNQNKHKSGFLELKDFLPEEYVHSGNIEKSIFQEHKRWQGTHKLEANANYTHTCRGLKTYGVTFFLIKERITGKRKLVPCLLGITTKTLVRMDKETKEITKTWPLTTIKRWAAKPDSFTLDFGHYSDSYYSVQTQEGEQISRLIASHLQKAKIDKQRSK